jgi:mono/diheme cytochrome c family protein
MKVIKNKAVEIKTSAITIALLVFILIVAINIVRAQSSKAWIAPPQASEQKNPVTANAAVIADAQKIYSANCTPCHGTKGKGDGPAAANLNPKPADHSSAAVQAETDGSLFYKLSEGRTPMPQYKKIFTDQQRWELVCYIRTLAKKAK